MQDLWKMIVKCLDLWDSQWGFLICVYYWCLVHLYSIAKSLSVHWLKRTSIILITLKFKNLEDDLRTCISTFEIVCTLIQKFSCQKNYFLDKINWSWYFWEQIKLESFFNDRQKTIVKSIRNVFNSIISVGNKSNWQIKSKNFESIKFWSCLIQLNIHFQQ